MASAPEMRPDVLNRLLSEKMRGHPLPWRIEQDWTAEVYDARNKLVLKCMNVSEASELIELALNQEQASNEVSFEIAKLLDSDTDNVCTVCKVPAEFCNGYRVGCDDA